MMGIDWAYGFDKIRGSSDYGGSQVPLYLRTRILIVSQKPNVMRKSVLLMILLFAVGMTASAQKFALIDTEYYPEEDSGLRTC